MFVLIAFSNFLCFAGESTSQSKKKILVLHTFKANRPWTLLFNRYLVEEMQEHNIPDYELKFENLDLLQFGDKNYKEVQKKLLELKYANSVPNIIIATLSPAIKFVIENNLFQDVPKIFIQTGKSVSIKVPNSVVIPVIFDFKGNIEHCLKLLPDTKIIYVVAGHGNVDKRIAHLFSNETKDLLNKVSFDYITEKKVEELLSRVENLPPNSIIW